MDSRLWQRLKPLLDAALKEPESERLAFVEAACAGDPELKNELLRLLHDGETGELPSNSSAAFPRISAFAAGQVLLDRFYILRLIGRGGMGEVYEAEDIELGRIALKTIRQSVTARPGMLARFKQEIQLARKVSGENVCRIYELFTMPAQDGHGPAAFLTMEYLDGVVLAAKLRSSPLSWEEARQIALDLCAGLTAIHEAGVLHRDLKSSNVMLVQRHGQQQAVLTDFGLATPLDPDSSPAAREASQVIAGTPEYMAPEQFEGSDLTRAADIYALGVILYEMVTGQQPYPAHTPLAAAVRRARKPELRKAPRGWREIIFRCLEYDPAKRYKSAAELGAALRRAANPVALVTHDTALFIRRFKIGVAITVLAAVAAGCFYLVRRMSLHTPPAEAVKLYDKGVAALREATYVKAIHALQSAVDRDPSFAMAHARLAEAWSELDFTGTADHEMLLATTASRQQRISPADRKYLAASQATLTRDYPDAVRQYREILDSEPEEDQPAALVDLGRAEEKAGQTAAALQEYEKAAKRAPDQPAAFVHIGILESRMQHAAAANTAFAQAEKLYLADENLEGLAEVEYQQGYLANEQGDTKAARLHLDKALEDARRIPSVQLEIRTLTQLSSVASDAKDQTEAADYANQAIYLANSNQLQYWAADGLVRLAITYESGDPASEAKAEQLLQQAIQIAHQSDQRRVEARANIEMANLRKDHPDQVIVYATRALDYYKKNGFEEATYDASILLARAQRDQGQINPALKTSEEMLSLAEKAGSKTEISLAQDLTGTLLMRQEKYPSAAASFANALSGSTEANRPYVARHYAEALWRSGQYDSAEEILRQYPARAGSTPEAVVRVNMQLSQRNYAGALALSEAALADVDPDKWPWELVIAKAIAEAHTGNAQDAERLMADIKSQSNDARLLASWNLSAAEIELLKKNPAEARQEAEAAMDYYKQVGAPESELLGASFAAQADHMSGDAEEEKKSADFGLDILRQLQQSWSPTQFQSFVSRPDIKNAAQQLQLSSRAI